MTSLARRIRGGSAQLLLDEAADHTDIGATLYLGFDDRHYLAHVAHGLGTAFGDGGGNDREDLVFGKAFGQEFLDDRDPAASVSARSWRPAAVYCAIESRRCLTILSLARPAPARRRAPRCARRPALFDRSEHQPDHPRRAFSPPSWRPSLRL